MKKFFLKKVFLKKVFFFCERFFFFLKKNFDTDEIVPQVVSFIAGRNCRASTKGAQKLPKQHAELAGLGSDTERSTSVPVLVCSAQTCHWNLQNAAECLTLELRLPFWPKKVT